MGKAIFVSYKYKDVDVKSLPGDHNVTTARQYVDVIQEKLDEGDHLYKGERDDEDMGDLEDGTIQSKLGDKIFYSSVTLVLISPGMKEAGKPESDQWIPKEVRYSLREQSRDGGKSRTNAVLAVVLPDANGSYEYYITRNERCGSRTLRTHTLFQILRDNMFNRKDAETKDCHGTTIYYGESSYIKSVKWGEFIGNIDKYIDIALSIQQDKDSYELVKKIT